MSTPRYLVAKYIPDLQRFEPRNVGVVVWSPEGVAARFLAEKPGRPGEVDGRGVPAFVASAPAYRQWIRFWRAELARPEITALKGGKRVPRKAPEFLEALRSNNRGNFVLAEGGFLLDPVRPEELPGLADKLFGQLVEGGPPEGPPDAVLHQVCDRLIKETGLRQDPHFRSKQPVSCRINGDTVEQFEFSHAYQNGALQRLYQRMVIPRKQAALRKATHHSAWMFDRVIQAKIIQRNQGGVLVHVPPEQARDPEVGQALRVLESVTRVLNLTDAEKVRAEFLQLRGLAGH